MRPVAFGREAPVLSAGVGFRCMLAGAMLKAATSLAEMYKTLSPKPLITREELDAFYSSQLNAVRGEDHVDRLALGLERAFGGSPFKAFLMGHPGVGKSTELSRLVQRIHDRYSVVRFSVKTELDPSSFKPFDLLLLMMAEVAERTKPSETRLKELWDWFSQETHTVKRSTQTAGELSAGAGLKGDSLWAKMTGLFASVKGEIKYAADRKVELVEYRFSRLSKMIELANRLLDECNRLLREAEGKEWLFIGEDFDKPGIAPQRLEEFFLDYGNVIQDLRAHMIFTLPIILGYSQQAVRLPVSDAPYLIPDTPVFHADHSVHRSGREAVRSVLEARADSRLFARGVVNRLVVASGGNLRDLLQLTDEAANKALLSGAQSVALAHARTAIDRLRLEYTRRLGSGPFDPDEILYEDKAKRLVQIYEGESSAAVPDAVLYSLLRSRAVQEFNGKGWFGVHPLVVDILRTQGRLPDPAPGGAE